jgi:dTDP-4-amino-4,6-dideoxygalactose transaminase
MNIPFLDLKAINARHAAELKAAAARVIDSGWYVLGEEVKAFEAEFGAWVGSPHCVGTSDGLSALILALRGWRELGLLRDGDAVAVPANTYIASILAITENRLRPVLVEPDEDTFNLGAVKLAAALTPDVKAVLAVHLYGQLVDMAAIARLCRERGLLLLEDAAQAHGAHIDGVKAGAWGDAAAFSFYPTKNLGALGDGGAVFTPELAVAAQVRLLRQYGWRQRYVSEISGRNSRLDELQAAVLRVKLKYLDAENSRRQTLANRYLQLLAGCDLTLPVVGAGVTPVWHQFTVRSSRRDELLAHLGNEGIRAGVLYPTPLHWQPAYADSALSLPITERSCAEVLCLPVHPGLDLADIDRAAGEIVRWATP